jgi:hypothetical protein
MFRIFLFMVFDILIDCQCFPFWASRLFALPFQTRSLQKYYKFQCGPPVNYNHLFFIFVGSTSTGKWRYANTQSTLKNACEENDVNLNLPPAIINLTEPQCAHASNSKGKWKLKRPGCPLQGSHSSKHSSKGEKYREDAHLI